MSEEILQPFLKIMPVLKEILQEDIFVSVTDTSTFLYYRPGDKIDAKIEVGSKIPAEDLLYKTVKEGKGYSAVVPKEIFGTPFKGVTYPIKNSDGDVIGAVGVGRSLDRQVKLEESADTLFSGLEETSAGIEEINSGSEKMNQMVIDMSEITRQAEKQIAESNEIISMIQNIASQSNLLGLNAAIEAARSGEQGKGFTVVASEMRKLAQLSSESSQKVSKALSEISNNIKNIFETVNQVQSVSEKQVTAMKEITSTLEEITASAQTMTEISRVE
ncbi:Putative sensory transducer protein YfmS [Clostridiaceae bacterium BL-3]|nr:Putative sensory transducer protein YfmS [Clostridiaceae bacterium BL-3]